MTERQRAILREMARDGQASGLHEVDGELLARLRRRVREDDGTRYPLGDVLRQVVEGGQDDG